MTATHMHRDARVQRSLVTPEGVNLNLELASIGQRFGALVIDMAIIIGAIIILTIVALLAAANGATAHGTEIVAIIWLLGLFFLRNGYFLFFEMSGRAATWGKRAVGIRVASRDGGRLGFHAVFTRNALRELELFLPLTVLIGAPIAGQGEGWTVLLSLIWCGVFVLLPMFNRDKLRAGDLVAGTWVVKAPRQKLLRDMADDGAAHRNAFDFTVAQLDAYGVKELQVLEQVLRTPERATVRAVADRIANRIGYNRGPASDMDFLRAYYHALRGRLEARLLMGRRRQDKFDTTQ